MRLHEYVTSFKRKNDVTPPNATIDVILQYQLTSASVRFPRAFKTVDYNTFLCPHLWKI